MGSAAEPGLLFGSERHQIAVDIQLGIRLRIAQWEAHAVSLRLSHHYRVRGSTLSDSLQERCALLRYGRNNPFVEPVRRPITARTHSPMNSLVALDLRNGLLLGPDVTPHSLALLGHRRVLPGIRRKQLASGSRFVSSDDDRRMNPSYVAERRIVRLYDA